MRLLVSELLCRAMEVDSWSPVWMIRALASFEPFEVLLLALADNFSELLLVAQVLGAIGKLQV